MPELPEVEGARRLVERHCQGKKIVNAIVADDDKVINDVAPAELQAALRGRTLLAAKRRGKQMWWELDSGPALLVHFGMTGGLVVKGLGAAHYKSFHIDSTEWPPKYCKLQLELEDGTQLAFCDSRRFARVRFLEAPETRPPISQLGWDPILDWPAVEAFAARLAGKRQAIKAVLLDQSFSAGVGNWVADEVLYQSRIHPEQPANSIPADQVAALHESIREVCQVACAVDADAARFPATWLFHFRWSKGAASKSKVEGRTIDHITVGGRTSAFVPTLQKLDKAAIAAAAAGAARKKAAAGGGRKKRSAGAGDAAGQEVGEAQEAAQIVEEAVEDAAAAAAPAAATLPAAAAPGKAAKPRGSRGRSKGVAPEAAAGEGDAGSGAVPGGRKATRGRGSKQQPQATGAGAAAAAPPAEAEGAGPAATGTAASGRGAKSFRGRQAPAAAEHGDATAAGKAGTAGRAAGRKRKVAVEGADSQAAQGGSAVVKVRRSRAAS